MADTPFQGRRGSLDFVTNGVAENWRQKVMLLYPNGMAPLTAMTSMMKSNKLTNGALFHWWTQSLPTQRVAVTGVYINATLTTAYVYVTHQATYGIDGATVYVKGSANDIKTGRVGHTVLLRDASRSDVDVRGKITAKQINGASSYWAVRLLEADDNSASASTYNIATVDVALIYGNANPEGSALPEAIQTDPSQHDNYTQIFRNSIDLTRTAYRTKLERTGQDPYKEHKRQALEFHSIEMEKAFFWGQAKVTTGDNGKPERYTQGVIDYIRTNSSAINNDFTLNTDFSGKTWVQSGQDWLDSYLERIFRFGSREKFAFVGSGALLGINQLAKAYGTIEISPTTTAYGMKVNEWITPFGNLTFKTHPLFSYEETDRNRMIIMEPGKIEYDYIDDTFYQEDPAWQSGGQSSVDAINEGYLTECGLEFGNPELFAMLNGVGLPSAV